VNKVLMGVICFELWHRPIIYRSQPPRQTSTSGRFQSSFFLSKKQYRWCNASRTRGVEPHSASQLSQYVTDQQKRRHTVRRVRFLLQLRGQVGGMIAVGEQKRRQRNIVAIHCYSDTGSRTPGNLRRNRPTSGAYRTRVHHVRFLVRL
jgi:hypothetical protein